MIKNINFNIFGIKKDYSQTGCSLNRFLRTFPCSILTPLLAAQFFHADLSHIPLQISKSRI